ncbi:formamidopyrimidine-DNA glycosylase [Coccidioides immitis RS]|uniref:Formamidopyrimidine-DNA glycosylase n=4 Tax=Coccidioides immitis TaxID=5501 RepID=J3KJL1_COCIM|nr:formamidopyrimidine-DNA glycosylase [Coccidioides immitis RS]KMP01605.1 hypothetical protein CIRG_01745 [Coccidioides immitis RMSCC 2394]KMU76421.1 AtMMH-1 [Coccidioides immitis RMSCC 3703]KMU87602.1 ATFPG-1/ATFPG-2/ATMMH-1/ATMMH-2/FPG-1/FPG-2 [Coccidioides immitis H538.4]TPX25596.1 hypothetical protein DIZ76_011051 [Coccidioides immitis]EAS36271.3 formamidopyrimidine-DNA glycosylase [Coccidioides immitis RS]
MPELAEVARIVHFIRKELVGKTVSSAVANHDDLIFGKVGTSAQEFQKTMQGNKIIGAGQQGKYFWMIMSKPPHPVMHFGMTGWLNIKGVNGCHYRAKEEEDDGPWPPKFWKFQLVMDDDKKTEAAFVDARRLGRVRLVDCPGEEIRSHTPLKENGPDPVIDKGIVTESWLKSIVSKKKVPIKALLLDQSIISGLGNWMADEVLYHSQIHPEQTSNTLDDSQIRELNSAIHYVCATSVDLLGDSARFPADWLMHHRWNKGKKEPSKMLNGDPVTFITVGGRTSAIVPAVQKKTHPTATNDKGGNAKEDVDDGSATKSRSKGRGKATVKETDETTTTNGNKRSTRISKASSVKAEEEKNTEGNDSAAQTPSRKRKAPAVKSEAAENAAGIAKKTRGNATKEAPSTTAPLRRGRSAAKK